MEEVNKRLTQELARKDAEIAALHAALAAAGSGGAAHHGGGVGGGAAAAAPYVPAAEAKGLGEMLLAACVEARAADALRIIDEGADLDRVNNGGQSSLMIAAMDARFDDVAERLADRGAKLDLVNIGGVSALMLACRHKRVATALMLVAKGAALDITDRSGETCLDDSDANGL